MTRLWLVPSLGKNTLQLLFDFNMFPQIDRFLSEEFMNKSDLAQALAQKDHPSVKNAKMVVDMIFEIMTESLVRGQKIEIRGFGSLTTREYGAYMGRNPRSGELIRVKEKKLPYFKIGKDLKDRLNAGNGKGEG